MDDPWKSDFQSRNGLSRYEFEFEQRQRQRQKELERKPPIPNQQGRDTQVRDTRNWKLVSDPILRPGTQKTYRFDGAMPGDTMPIVPSDPRSRIRRLWKREPVNIPVPKFCYDQYFVGTILPKEVTFTNLNDNINDKFLKDMCKVFGSVEEAKVFFNPKTKKHMGIGKVLFTSTRAARTCVDKLDQTSKMGNIITVFNDSMGKQRQNLIDSITGEKTQTFRPPSPKTPKKPDPRGKGFTMSVGGADFTPQSNPDSYPSGTPQSLPHTPQTPLFPDGYHGSIPRRDYPDRQGGYQRRDSRRNSGSWDWEDGRRGNHHDNMRGGQDNMRGGHGLDGGRGGMDGGRGGMDGGRGFHESRDSRGRGLDGPRGKDRHWESRDSYHKDRHRGDRGSRDIPMGDRGPRDIPMDRGERGYRRDRDYHPRDSRDRPDRDNQPRDSRPDRDNTRDNLRGDNTRGENRGRHRDRDRYHDDRHRAPVEWDPEPPSPSVPPPVVPPPSPPRPKTPEPPMSLEARIAAMLGNKNNDMLIPFGSPGGEEASSSGGELQEQPPDPGMTPGMTPVPNPGMTPGMAPPAPTPGMVPPMLQPPPLAGIQPGMMVPPPIPGIPPLPADPMMPPLPMGEAPPLPPPPASEDPAPPPLPPEPEPALENGASPLTMEAVSSQDELSPAPPGTEEGQDPGEGQEEDDRMSLSSISSGEEKLEVNQPLPQGTAPTNPSMWGPSFQNNMVNNYYNMYGQHYPNNMGMVPPPAMSQPPTNVWNAQDEEHEKTINNVINHILTDLKVIMRKDMKKKMVQNTAFQSYESWWTNEVELSKQAKSVKMFADKPSTSVAVPSMPQPSTSASVAPPTVRPKDTSASLAALFEKDSSSNLNSSFGMGGLLGLRGGIPKMPSFRKKWRPPSPPPEYEGGFKGPRTPEESENEDSRGVSDSDVPSVRGRRQVIYSSDSDESEKQDSEDEDEVSAASSEDEEEEEGSEEERGSDGQSEGEDESDDDYEEEESEAEEEEDEEDESQAATVTKEESGDDPSSEVDILGDDTSDRDLTRPEASMETSESKDEKIREGSAVVPEDDEAAQAAEDVHLKPTPPVKEEEEKMDAEVTPEVKPAEVKVEEPSRPPTVLPDTTNTTPDRPIKPEQEVTPKAAEEDAIMALLSMRTAPDVTPPIPVVPVPVKEEPPAPPAELSEHNYFAHPEAKPGPPPGGDDETDSASEGEPELIPCLPGKVSMDHNYCQPYLPVQDTPEKKRRGPRGVITSLEDLLPPAGGTGAGRGGTGAGRGGEIEVEVTTTTPRPRKRPAARKKQLKDVTNIEPLPPPPKPKPKYTARPIQEEVQITYDFLLKGIDAEDIAFLKSRYEELLQDDSPQTYWLNDTHWVDHCNSLIPDPPKKRRKLDTEPPRHKTGSARTEGYYKISHQAKSSYLHSARGVLKTTSIEPEPESVIAKKKVVSSRETRQISRRWANVLTSLGDDISFGDLLKFNQLKLRGKQLKFAKSAIHDWGLFALEPIAEGEMVIEYVGQSVRQSVADLRETKYEQQGIGSSYLFRVDQDTIIDATKCGNLARFVNHSCNPNCIAKIVTVESMKKIVIYSKVNIDVNEEITYDYKFPLEDEKIPCFCGAPGCRGTLN